MPKCAYFKGLSATDPVERDFTASEKERRMIKQAKKAQFTSCFHLYDSELYTVCNPDDDPIDYEHRHIEEMAYIDYEFEKRQSDIMFMYWGKVVE